jgi:predicted nucleic acid-binding protein
MGTQYLIDSNAVIDYLSGKLPPTGMTFMSKLVNDTPKISLITKIEVLGFRTSIEAEKLLTDFTDDCLVLPITEEISDRTIELRKDYKIKLPDALIAATALVYNFTLVSRNVSDFKRIIGLNCVDAHLM